MYPDRQLTETEQHGQRHTVWVLMDDEIEDIAEVSTGNTNGHFPEVSEHIGDETRAANLALEGEVSGLRDLVELYRERLTDSDWRYQELMEQFKTMAKALPMAPEELPRPKRRGRYNWQPNRPQQAKGAGPAIS